MGSVTRRIKNNVIARKMAINAGLVIPPDTDPMFPEGLGLHRTEYRRSMLRLYRQRRAHRKAAKAGRKAGTEHAKASPQHKPTPWYKRMGRAFRRILPTGNRGA